MQRVKNGDKVRINFTGRFLDGRVFDTSTGRDPLELTVADKAIIPGLQRALLGMTPGESKTAIIPAAEAFGSRSEELVMRLDPKVLPDEVHPQVGEIVQLQSERGTRLTARIVQASSDEITLDANHPLAGHDLTFEIELLGIGSAAASN